MGMPMPPLGQEQEGPINGDMIMALREAARGRQNKNGAASRRLGQHQMGMPPGGSEGLPEGLPEGLTGGMPDDGTTIDGQSPEELMLADMQEQMDAEVEPPEITNNAAALMMRYGAIQEYLMRARGELPNA